MQVAQEVAVTTAAARRDPVADGVDGADGVGRTRGDGDDRVARAEAELNRRPRKVLDWDSPTDRMATLLATTSVLRR